MRLIIIFIILLFPCNLLANVSFIEIEVKEFKDMGNNEYLLAYRTSEKSNNKDIQKLHIRFNKNCITELLQSKDTSSEYRKYLSAVEELKTQIASSPLIQFGLKSGKGCHSIPGKTNEFQADNLGIVKINEKQIVYSIHSDIGSGYCNR